jgi:FAD/FMN-containing dehydrogenase
MNKSGGSISRRELMVGSAAAGGLALLGAPEISFAQTASDVDATAASGFDDLAGLIRGDLILPGHDAYDEARNVWNGMIDKRPAAIARCTGAADVMDVVKYARDNDIPASVRGGGHNVAGKALKDDAITIDLAEMNGIWIDPARKRARVQGGAKWVAFDRESLALDLVTTGGTVSTTGVGGLTLGGGLGWIMRKHGLCCDNVMSADVVTADGRLLVVNENENSDLYWAIRGGGGNFGIVTAFEFKLHDLEPITGGMAIYPESMLKEMFHFYREYTSNAPDSVTAGAGYMAGPPGTPLEGQSAGVIVVCHKGPAGDGERLVKPIKDFGPPTIDSIGPSSYPAMQAQFDAGSPPGLRNYWRSNFMTELSDAAIDTMLARSGQLPHPASMLFIENLGGAVGRVGANDTAFSNRDAQYNASIFGMWADADDDERNISWVRTFGDELKAFATGGAYVNYMASDESAGNVKAAYETNFKRLTEVKRKYDPTNFFNVNQNIVP